MDYNVRELQQAVRSQRGQHHPTSSPHVQHHTGHEDFQDIQHSNRYNNNNSNNTSTHFHPPPTSASNPNSSHLLLQATDAVLNKYRAVGGGGDHITSSSIPPHYSEGGQQRSGSYSPPQHHASLTPNATPLSRYPYSTSPSPQHRQLASSSPASQWWSEGAMRMTASLQHQRPMPVADCTYPQPPSMSLVSNKHYTRCQSVQTDDACSSTGMKSCGVGTSMSIPTDIPLTTSPSSSSLQQACLAVLEEDSVSNRQRMADILIGLGMASVCRGTTAVRSVSLQASLEEEENDHKPQTSPRTATPTVSPSSSAQTTDDVVVLPRSWWSQREASLLTFLLTRLELMGAHFRDVGHLLHDASTDAVTRFQTTTIVGVRRRMEEDLTEHHITPIRAALKDALDEQDALHSQEMARLRATLKSEAERLVKERDAMVEELFEQLEEALQLRRDDQSNFETQLHSIRSKLHASECLNVDLSDSITLLQETLSHNTLELENRLEMLNDALSSSADLIQIRDDEIHLQRRTIISLGEELAVSKDRVSSQQQLQLSQEREHQQQTAAILAPRPPTLVDAACGTADAEEKVPVASGQGYENPQGQQHQRPGDMGVNKSPSPRSTESASDVPQQRHVRFVESQSSAPRSSIPTSLSQFDYQWPEPASTYLPQPSARISPNPMADVTRIHTLWGNTTATKPSTSAGYKNSEEGGVISSLPSTNHNQKWGRPQSTTPTFNQSHSILKPDRRDYIQSQHYTCTDAEAKEGGAAAAAEAELMLMLEACDAVLLHHQ